MDSCDSTGQSIICGGMCYKEEFKNLDVTGYGFRQRSSLRNTDFLCFYCIIYRTTTFR